MTLGIAEILASRQILLLVSGASKAAILKRLLESPVTTRLPASFLWLHPNVTILCDRDATR
jgi:6-phosphogluconolactonase/glucosamine-6-phosphate isomerase/deaminase